jgi:hypothetical protein
MYYQARVNRRFSWFVVAVLKSYEHVAFDRTIDVDQSIFEFFVPVDTHHMFVYVIERLEKEGLVTDRVCLPNRFCG